MREVLFISNYIGNGGAARVLVSLAEQMSTDGFSVTVCSFYGKFDSTYTLRNDIQHIVLYPQHNKGIRGKIDRIKLLHKEIEKHKNAIIISFEYFINMQTIISKIGCKNRLIISERNDPAVVGGGFPGNIIRNFLYRFADILVCQTPDAKQYFPEYIQKKTEVIPNPVKDNLPEPYQNVRKKRIVNFCRIEKQKNLPLLIDAYKMLSEKYPDYELRIYGNGSETEHIKEYIAQKGADNQVKLFSAIPNIHQEVLDAAMFVSSSDYEGLSNSMLEAMAIGLPVVCTDCPCGGARMIIRDGVNGRLVPTNNVDALSKAMLKVIEDKTFSSKISYEACKIKKELSLEKIAGKWEQLF